MRIAIQAADDSLFETRKKLAALPAGLQADVYGDGFYEQAKRAARKSRRLVLPRGEGPAKTPSGKPRRHLAKSIRAIRVAWRYAGVKVPRSAAIVLAEQPHAHLIEKGTERWKRGPRPYLEPPMKDAAMLLDGFRVGTAKSFRNLIRRLESGKLRGRERKAFRR